MANLKSAIKAIRVSKRKKAKNIVVREKYRAVARDIRKALEAKKATEAEKLLPKYQSEIDKAVKKGIIKKNTGARYKSRIVKRILAIKAK